MSVKKDRRNAAKEKREEEQAQKVVKGIFIGLIVLAIIAMVAFSL